MAQRPTSVAAPLAWMAAAVILYASLYPFSGWRWPPGRGLADLLALPWPPWRDPFDLWANLLGYLPWGWLMALAVIATRRAAWWALLAAVLVAAATSYAVEVIQTFLPGRHPSLKDCAMNTLGAALGALAALSLSRLIQPWATWRNRWFVPRSGGALALLALWPLALLFPTPLPLGLGQVAEKLREAGEWLLEGVPWAEPLLLALQAGTPAPEPLAPLSEGLVIALGLLGPCMLAYAVTPVGWPRWVLAGGAAAVAVATLTLSSLLNYGPAHALAWPTAATLPAMASALLAACTLAWIPRRAACGLALLALAGASALIAQAPTDPYFAQSLQDWEQGRWVRFHGLSQWVGLAWPYAAMVWVLHRLAQRDDGER